MPSHPCPVASGTNSFHTLQTITRARAPRSSAQRVKKVCWGNIPRNVHAHARSPRVRPPRRVIGHQAAGFLVPLPRVYCSGILNDSKHLTHSLSIICGRSKAHICFYTRWFFPCNPHEKHVSSAKKLVTTEGTFTATAPLSLTTTSSPQYPGCALPSRTDANESNFTITGGGSPYWCHTWASKSDTVRLSAGIPMATPSADWMFSGMFPGNLINLQTSTRKTIICNEKVISISSATSVKQW